jgi:agmatinase
MKTSKATKAAIFGIQFEGNSSLRHGTAEAPEEIRSILHSGASNLCTESGIDLEHDTGWVDAGDLIPDGNFSFPDSIQTLISTYLNKGLRLLILGGDHSITYPSIRAFAEHYNELSILQLDAHPDLYDSYDGNRYSHASPFARIMEENLAKRLVQIGIRTMNPHQKSQAERFNVEIIHARDWRMDKFPVFQGPVYLSIDLDVLDTAFAPGVSHPEPGGLTTRDIISIIQTLKPTVVGCDLVEYNPRRDIEQITGVTVVKLLKECLGKLLEE